MEELKPEMVRVNTRISVSANKWLDEQSRETGIPKSTLILLAIETYKQQRETVAMMADVGQLIQKLDDIERKIADK